MTRRTYEQRPRNNEIDVNEFALILWKRKLTVLVCAITVCIVATIYAYSQPNIYSSRAQFFINYNPLPFASQNEGIPASKNLKRTALVIESYLKSEHINKMLERQLGQRIPVNISVDSSTALVTVSRQGKKAQEVNDSIALYIKNIGSVIKQDAKERFLKEIESLKKNLDLKKEYYLDNSNNMYYSQTIYNLSIIEVDSNEIIQLVSKPSKSKSPIRPKKKLILVLGFILGLMLGAFWVWAKLLLKPKKDENCI